MKTLLTFVLSLAMVNGMPKVTVHIMYNHDNNLLYFSIFVNIEFQIYFHKIFY